MVLRKSSHSAEDLPYPTSPKQSKAPAEPSINPQNHLDVDTSDVPPIPVSKQRQMDATGDSPYHDFGNPWSQETGSQQQVPPVLQPGRSQYTQAGGPGDPNLPQPLRVGGNDQVTPRSSLDSVRSRGFWEDDEVNDDEDGQVEDKISDAHGFKPQEKGNGMLPTPLVQVPVPSSPGGIKRKPVPSGTPEQHPADNVAISAPNEFASNNPFRRSLSAEHTGQAEPLSSSNAWSEQPQLGSRYASPKGKGKEILRDPDHDNSLGLYVTNPTPENKSQTSLHPGLDVETATQQQQSGAEDDLLLPEPTSTAPPPPHPNAAPPPIPQIQSPFSSQPPLIPVSSEATSDDNPWFREPAHAPPPPPSAEYPSHARLSQYSDTLLDRGQETGVVSLGNELNSLPNAAELDTSNDGPFSSSHNDFDDARPPLPSRSTIPNSHGYQQPEKEPLFGFDDQDDFRAPEGPPPTKPPRPRPYGNSGPEGDYFNVPEGPPPTKPPRPAVVTTVQSDERQKKMNEQRSETYQIKHFNWFDHRSGSIRTSSMLTQNKNGPCPLLALVNALILGVSEDDQAALDNALRAREQVTLGLIIETLIDELISSNYEGLPDVDELNRFLLMLHTGMNANPRFVTPPTPAPNLMDARNSMLHLPQPVSKERTPGSFESTQDMKLYGAFSVPLVHGWLPSKREPAWKAFTRSAQTYEDAQALQFGEEELEYKLSHGGLSEDEERVWQDITSIKKFLEIYPTQLTPYGLDVIREWLLPAQFAIMFRNDHFSTIYKHPDGKLFTLITDAGYAERDEIVWESLTDHNGASEFFSGDFRPVGGEAFESASAADPSGPRQSSQYLSTPNVTSPISPQERQEQHDADFAMALQLQEEEEQRANQNRRRSGTNPNSGPGRNTEGNIPIRLRSREQPQEVRPSIPPRTSRTQNPAVNRPAEDIDDAPPAYEEATKSKPYIPPLTSPHHPTADPSPRASTTQLGGTTPSASNSRPPPPQDGPRRLTHQRRMSAYGENTSRYAPPGSYGAYGPASPSVGRPMGNAYGVGSGAGQGRSGQRGGGSGQDRDCLVM